MDNEMRHQLAQLSVKLGLLRQASLFDKAALAQDCLSTALVLFGAMVARIETLEKEQQK